ncbi:NAD(P)H-dependent oxidoreductase [Changchengzhania lutea]|uniref:NAD(P)H-dependent oxidoreductase n=1 Tax=Changchengzhania lutea TaxID=2049305 RepID=UPI00115C5F05|nr:NAD(P)H-dependent oxidoreductase [Changchengzhania lutea]
MDTIKQLEWRYATKKFDPKKKLENNKLQVLKKAFNLTATSFGLQTIKMLVIKDEQLRETLVPHAFQQRQLLEASHLLVICIQEDIDTTDVVNYYKNIKSIRNTSDNILNPYKQQLVDMMENMTVSGQQQWSKNQAYIALGNLMTVCAIEHIDSCPMEGFLPNKFDELLHLKEKNLKSVLLLPVGYRHKDDIFADLEKVRKPIHEAVIEF